MAREQSWPGRLARERVKSALPHAAEVFVRRLDSTRGESTRRGGAGGELSGISSGLGRTRPIIENAPSHATEKRRRPKRSTLLSVADRPKERPAVAAVRHAIRQKIVARARARDGRKGGSEGEETREREKNTTRGTVRSSWRRVHGGEERDAKGGKENEREMETQVSARARASSRSKEKANKAG